MDQLQHAEAITLFGKVTRNCRQLDLQIERQSGFEVEKTIQIVLNKAPGQQVGIKLVTQLSQVNFRFSEVVNFEADFGLYDFT